MNESLVVQQKNNDHHKWAMVSHHAQLSHHVYVRTTYREVHQEKKKNHSFNSFIMD